MKTLSLVLCVVLAWVSVARADDIDTVVLKNGTVLRGHVAKLVPGKLIRIQLITGEVQTLEYADVERTSGPSFPPDTVGVYAAVNIAPEPSQPWLQPAPDRVRVDLRSVSTTQQEVSVVTDAATGYASNGVSATWIRYLRLCRTPCSIYARPGELALLAGGVGIRSHAINLDVPRTGMEVTLRAPSIGKTWGGLMLSTFGIVSSLIGVIVGPIGASARTVDSNGDWHHHPNVGLTAAGFTMLGLGIAMTVPGILLLRRAKGGVESYRALQLAEGKVVF